MLGPGLSIQTFVDFLENLRDEVLAERLTVMLNNNSIRKAKLTVAKAAKLKIDMLLKLSKGRN